MAVNASFTPSSLQSTSMVPSNASQTNESTSIPDGCIIERLPVLDYIPWDNPDNLVSQEVERTFDTAVVVSLYVLFLISAPTNIISMIVFYKQGLKERINFCLFVQSLSDLLYMTFNFVYYSDRVYLEMTTGARRGTISLFVLQNYLLGFLGLGWWSSFVTMVIAVERCFCVVSPMKAQRILQTKTMATVIFSALVLLLTGFFVIATRWGTICVFNPTTKSTSVKVYPREFYFRHREIIDFLDSVLYGVIIPGTAVLVVFLCTIITVVKLRKMTSWREKSSSAGMSTREVALTKMLVGASVLFIACTIPSNAFRVLIMFAPDFSLTGRYYNAFNLGTSISELSVYFNSSFNFFIYYNMGSKYKATVKNMFRRNNTQN